MTLSTATSHQLNTPNLICNNIPNQTSHHPPDPQPNLVNHTVHKYNQNKPSSLLLMLHKVKAHRGESLSNPPLHHQPTSSSPAAKEPAQNNTRPSPRAHHGLPPPPVRRPRP
ncbi:hypothetical protein CONLIGDRAFT_638544 [Coniochaeta ligniaria NRRL 30616]|uniref:Uncharacterized protein n=1 Tax=Coniochaeta ligniaria NRRL 30616 TaxID=1408157 RepID=A0A1J7I3U8_9PEZI|nr:hypothetical protein CONLIGDRAFT_638544 [Coniochaeta ligniaria NRRL 30616]